MNNFQVISKLGEGAYSKVYKVKRLIDEKIYALKKVKLSNLSEKEKENALNEVRILASVRSKFVISYKEAFFDEKDKTLGIVMEFADNGDLYQKIVEHKKAAMFFEESDIWRIFIQLVKGLKALHELKILHRDLKSANVFLETDGSAKLGDLNVSKVARKGLGYTQTGTPYYASPEVWKDKPYDSKSDIWSLGCVLYEMITLRPPFRAQNMEGLYNKVIKGQFSKLLDRFSPDLETIVRLLIQVNPDDRPTCDQILKNPIILKRIEYFKAYSNDDASEDQALLQTIRIPKNLLFLSDKLPRPNYDSQAIKHQKNYRSFSNNMDNEQKKLLLKPIVSISPPKEQNVKESENINNNNNNNRIKNIVPEREGRENVNNSYVIRPVIRELSPKKRIITQNPRQLPNIENVYLNLKGELPQIQIISSNKGKIEQNRISNPKLRVERQYGRYVVKNPNNNNNKIDDLYKIYIPYLNLPIGIKNYNINNNINSRIRMNPNIYLKNIDRYYDNINLKKVKSSEGPEIKSIPLGKLSPIRKSLPKIM